jgi:crotonobetainyl-CoA:carnitine CoA-transferase CaiB-like acyl-CoA transferase
MGVLDGITVLELARVAPAELPGMMFADMGADVLKIETPEEETPTPDAMRRAAFAYVNRNKRSLALNLKAPDAYR